jgi:hypothetical protein
MMILALWFIASLVLIALAPILVVISASFGLAVAVLVLVQLLRQGRVYYARARADRLARIFRDVPARIKKNNFYPLFMITMVAAIGPALVVARLLALGDAHAASDRVQNDAEQLVPLAAGLLAAAVRLLPASDRTRYTEEYRAELWDLAQAGAGRIRQLLYALCQIRSAHQMGVALRAPRRRSAVP